MNVVDAKGQALRKQPVKLAVAKGGSAVDVWAGGEVHLVDETGVTLTTDAMGKLTVAVMATAGLACPPLVVSGAGLAQPVTIQPAGDVHRYLSGEGTLNPSNPGGPLPVFDKEGNTLARAKVNGKPLAPGASGALKGAAADAIRNGAAMGAGTSKVHGFSGSFVGTVGVHTFHSESELAAHRETLGLEAGLGDVESFFEDIFEGIKNGVIAITHFVVDVVNKTIDLALKIADWTTKVAKLAFEGIEKIADFISGVFHAVEAAIEKVVDWLKALFDFRAIWHTKMALQEAILKVPGYVEGLARSGQKAADKWFARQKKEVNAALDEIARKYEGQTFGSQPGWLSPNGPPDTKTAGGVSVGDFTSNPHHNWLQDKVSSYSPDRSGVRPSSNDPWEAFGQHLLTAGQELQTALEHLAKAGLTLIKDPESFATMGIAELVRMVRDLVDAMLDLCDAMADALMGLAVDAMKALQAVLEAELKLGPLNTLWQWIAEQAGYPKDGKLTIGALIALAAAFPCTIVYKLIEGVDHEPFKDGKFVVVPHQGVPGTLGKTVPKPYRELSCILRMFQVIPAVSADVAGPLSPWWLTLLSLGYSLAVWVLANGFPELSGLQWATLSASAANLLWIAPTVYFTLKAEKAVLDKISKVKDDAAALGTTALGVLTLSLGIYKSVADKQTAKQTAASVLQPMDSLFDFLNLSVIRNSPAGPYAIGGKVFFDFVGCVIGGALQLSATLEQPSESAA